MSIHFDARRFANARPLPVFVLVDPSRRHLTGRTGFKQREVAGILAQCRAALSHARAMGMPVAFVRDAGSQLSPSGWIKGFEPSRDDMIFERRAPSCYSCSYFGEMAQSHADLVIAGFLGAGGGLATAAAGVRGGHRITFLRNAVLDRKSVVFLHQSTLELIDAFTDFDIHAVDTSSWIAATAHRPADRFTDPIVGRCGASRIPPNSKIDGVR